jgi:leucine dehydrogenase
MEIFKLMQKSNSNEVVFFEEPSVSLRTIIAVNDTTLGPAIATCRLQDYGQPEKATETALSMAYYNTYRAALLHRGFGGAGLTLCGDPAKVKNEMYFRALGIFINKLNGKLNLVRSSGISHKDMLDIKRESNYLLGVDERYIKSGNSPVEAIAKGMIWGIKAIVRKKFNAESLEGLSFAVQGVGELGSNFVKELLKIDGVKITVTDIVYDKIKVIQDHSPNVKVVKPQEIYKQQCDVFVSCATNNIISEEEEKQLKCKIITGSSNEFLANKKVEKDLEKMGVAYVPGFVINGGEIIQLDNEFKGNEPCMVDEELPEIYNVTLDLLNEAEKQNKSITEIAIETAQKYIDGVASIKKLK